ncbi:hypothetical protein RD792_017463 [Penstemon davidsonii]|uniref:C2H2-type domain-containing protein n=1 Tax=Penstemon davidsonii TaxID=160366 RepID=A0ABR0CNT8_9LAMI|nr:hypothetical protein RD792_017463 [Penstemon davidsonii]
MEHGKQCNSDTSSAENDHHQPEKSSEDNTGIGRSYECTFCKRGFTNAQALGGHMNIHRKDKAKAKKKNEEEKSSSDQKIKSNLNSRYDSTNHILSTGYYGLVGADMNFQVYLPSSNPSFQTRNYSSNSPVSNMENLEEDMDPNLGLRIGLTPPIRDVDVKENEIDLELRLGHDP